MEPTDAAGPVEVKTGPITAAALTPAELLAALARIDERLAVLEAAAGTAAESKPSEEEVARLAWAVKHGRQRPW